MTSVSQRGKPAEYSGPGYSPTRLLVWRSGVCFCASGHSNKTWRSGNSCSEPNGTAAIDPSPAALGYLCYFSRLAALSQASRSDPCILMMRCASDVAMPCFSANVATWYGSRPENPGSALPRRGLWFDTTASSLRGRRTGDCISPLHTLLLLQAALAILDLRTQSGRGAFGSSLVLFGLPNFLVASYLTLGHLRSLLVKTDLAIIGR